MLAFPGQNPRQARLDLEWIERAERSSPQLQSLRAQAEAARQEVDRAEAEARRAEEQAEADAKAAAKESAMAKLAALGLSGDEISALI